jgi:hypothetical protein
MAMGSYHCGRIVANLTQGSRRMLNLNQATLENGSENFG